MNKEIEKMLMSTEPSQRREGCFSAVELNEIEYIDDIIVLLKDSDAGVREAALYGLEAFGGLRVAAGVAPLLRSEDAGIRNAAAELLETLGEDSIDPVMNLLHDDNDGVIKMAVDIISIVKTRKPEKALSELINHGNPNVRGAVALCLGKIKANEAKEKLVRALGDNEEWVRFSAADGLGFLGDTDAFDALVGAVDKDSEIVGRAAIEALVKISTADNCEIVLSKLESIIDSGSLNIPVSAVTEILKKATRGSGGVLLSNALTEGFREKLKEIFIVGSDDKDNEIRKASFEGLVLLKEVDGGKIIIDYINSLPDLTEEIEDYFTTLLIKLFGGLTDTEVLIEALDKDKKSIGILINVIGEIKAKEGIERLEELMFEIGHGELRLITEALGKINTKEAVNILTKSLESRDGHTRKIAALSLEGSDNEDIIPLLSDAILREEYRDVVDVMCSSLASIKSDRVKEFFLNLLDNENDILKQVAARGLGMIGGEDILIRLKDMANSSTPSVRKAVLSAMSALGLPEGLELVVQGLSDSDSDVRLAVLKCINSWNGLPSGGLGLDNLITALTECLSDSNTWVRYQAIGELGSLRAHGAEDLIIKILNEDIPPVKCSAARALALLESKKAIKPLEKLTSHEDAKVAQSARKALEIL